MKKIIIAIILLTIFCQPSGLNWASAESNYKGFSIRPANPNTIRPDKILLEARPGQELQEDLIIFSDFPREEIYYLYTADITEPRQKPTAYTDSLEKNKSVAGWITLSQTEIEHKKPEEVLVRATIKIPSDTPEKTYEAGIAVEKRTKSSNNQNITIASRIIIPVEIVVTATPQPVTHLNDLKTNIYNLQPYTLTSILIFGASMAYFTWASIRDHKKRKALTKTK